MAVKIRCRFNERHLFLCQQIIQVPVEGLKGSSYRENLCLSRLTCPKINLEKGCLTWSVLMPDHILDRKLCSCSFGDFLPRREIGENHPWGSTCPGRRGFVDFSIESLGGSWDNKH